ncbi:MAG: hypothetical protein Alpg2KO_27090 [Alphaproteobacteria bacterium]
MAIKGNGFDGFDGFDGDASQNGDDSHGLFDTANQQSGNQDSGSRETGLTPEASLAESSPIILETGDADRLTVPGRGAFLEGEFFRNDTDLEVRLPDGQLIVIQDYFSGDSPMLITEGGARISPELANVLAPDPTANMFAQAGDADGVQPVGEITRLKGTVYIQRNGEKIEANKGDQVFETDIVVTEDGAGAGITFIDGTNFGLGAQTRMAMTEFKWRPETDKGEVLFDVLQGAFSFTSGEAGKVKPDNIQIKMGSMSLGVRGTTVTGFNGEQTGEDSFVMLLEDQGGSVGKILVSVGDQEGYQLLESANTFVKTDIDAGNLPSFGRVADPADLVGTTGTNALDYLPSTGGSGQSGDGGNTERGDGSGDGSGAGTEDGAEATGEGGDTPPPAEGQGEGDQPPAPVEGQGEGEQPPAPVEGQGEGEQPPAPVEGQGEGEQPPAPVEGQGEGEQPPAPVEGQGEGEQPTTPVAGQDQDGAPPINADDQGDGTTPPLQDGNREVPPIIDSGNGEGDEDGPSGPTAQGEGEGATGPGQIAGGTEGGTGTGTGPAEGEGDAGTPPPVIDNGDDDRPGNANVTANADTVTVSEDGPRDAVNVIANDEDPDAGDRLGIVRLEGTEGLAGQVEVTPNRQGVVYNPNRAFEQLAQGETATETFQYRVTDGKGSFDTAVVTVTIEGQNDAPVARPDGAIITEGEQVQLDLLANDSDRDNGAQLRVIEVAEVTVDSDGKIIYDTADRFDALGDGQLAQETFTYRVTDEHGATATATVTMTIRGVNDKPQAFDDAFTVSDADGWVQLDLLANDTDADQNDQLQVISVERVEDGSASSASAPDGAAANIAAPVPQGELRVTDDGRVVYEPNKALAQGQTSVETYSYTMRDSGGETSTATVTVTVIGSNDDPIARDDSFQASEDGADRVLDVQRNDTDVDQGARLSVTAIDATGLKGTATLSADGQVVYDPNGAFESLNAGETATESFSYTLTDEHGATSTATVTVTINGRNDGPVTGADQVQAVEDGSTILLDVLVNDSDPDATGTLEVTSLNTSNLRGQATITDDGKVAYTIGSEFQNLAEGQTAVERFTYTVTDDQGATRVENATVTVTGRNDGPVAEADALTVSENSPARTARVLENDSDIDQGDSLTIAGIDADGLKGAAQIVTGPGGGQRIQYDVNGAFESLAVGQQVTETLTYRIQDSQGATATTSLTITIEGRNDGPQGVADTLTLSEDAGATRIDVLGNDTDVDDGAVLRIKSVDTNGLNGMVQITPDGQISYQPGQQAQTLAQGETATESFTYTVEDEHGATSTATVTVTVTGANDDPVANSEGRGIGEDDSAITIPVLQNDTDIDRGSDLTVQSVDTNGVNGQVQITPAGKALRYDPGVAFQYLGAGETATETITYTVTDEHGATDTATVTITVTGSNDGPVANADARTVSENSTGVGINVLGNDTDADDSAVLTIQSVNTGGVQGTVNIAPDGKSLRYDPNDQFEHLGAGQSATETFSYTMTDEQGATSVATVTVTVEGRNDGPVAVNDVRTVTEDDGATLIDVLGNDSDVDANANLTIQSVDTNGVQGAVQIAPGGKALSYNPGNHFNTLAAGQTAAETFTYTLVDDQGATTTATVTVTITGVNDGPVADADSKTVSEDAAAPVLIDVLANDADIDNGSSLSVEAVDQSGLLGRVVFSRGGDSLRYDPDKAFDQLAAGETATETFSYTVKDDQGATSTATVTVTITGQNDGPVAVNDVQTVTQNSISTTIQVLTNDSDADRGADLTVQSVDTLSLQGAVSIAPDGKTLRYDPGNAFISLGAGQSTTETFSYTLVDDQGATSTASVTVTITGTNDGPVANNDTRTIAEGSSATPIDVLGNDTDADANADLTIQSVDTLSLQGSVNIVPGGKSLTYDPAGNFDNLAVGETTTESFTYTLVDDQGATSTASVTVTITGTNDGPTANDDEASVNEDSSQALFALFNDTDPDTTDTLEISAVDTAGLQGQVTIAPDKLSLTYTPGLALQVLDQGDIITETFTYTISDGNGGTDTASITMTVTGLNDDPIANNDTLAYLENGEPVIINVVLNDLDVDQDSTLEVTAVNYSGDALVGLLPDKERILYGFDGGVGFEELSAGQTVTETITYTVQDEHGATDTATVTVTVTGVNDGPSAGNDGYVFTDDIGQMTLEVLDNDTDVDQNDVLTITQIDALTLPGTLSIAPDNRSLIYDPQGGFESLAVGETGTATFSYTISDGNGGTDTATVTLTVTGTNQDPQAVNDIFNINQGPEPITLRVADNDIDVDAVEPVEIWDFDDSGLQGDLRFNNDGDALLYNSGPTLRALAAGQTAVETFSYRIRDDEGAFSTATATITVTGINDAPEANDEADAVTEGQFIIIDAKANDLDVDTGDNFTIVSVDAMGKKGNITITPGNEIRYSAGTPWDDLALGQTATESFSYTIQDDGGLTDTGTITITVTGINDGPVAMDDSPVPIAENSGPMIFDVLMNDMDIDQGDMPSILSIDTSGIIGDAQIVTGGIRYDSMGAFLSLNDGQTATEVITYTVQDSQGATDTATLTIVIQGSNSQVNGGADNVIFAEGQGSALLDVLSNDVDPDAGDTLSIASVSAVGLPGDITIAGDGQSLTFTDTGMMGEMAAGQSTDYTFDYVVQDAGGTTDVVTATITFQGQNDTPYTFQDTATIAEDAGPTQLDVLSNDGDDDIGAMGATDADSLTITSIDDTGLLGQATITGEGIIYDPGAAFDHLADGETANESLVYTVTDDFGATATGLVTITVTGVNDAPEAGADAFTVGEDDGPTALEVLTNDIELDLGDILSLTGLSNVTAGVSASISGDQVIYDPGATFDYLNHGQTATDTFEYQVRDFLFLVDTETVTVTITGRNDQLSVTGGDPVTVNQFNSAVSLTDISITDPDTGDLVTVTATLGDIGHATLSSFYGGSFNAGTGTWSYTGTAHQATDAYNALTITAGNGFASTDLTVTVTDGAEDGTVPVELTVTLTAIDNTAPVAGDSLTSVLSGETLNSHITGAHDIDGDALTYALATQAVKGTVTLNSDGTYSYLPGVLMEGTDSFTYQVTDEHGAVDSGTVTITIGGQTGDDKLTNTTTNDDQKESDVAALADGGYVIVWTDKSASGDDTDGYAVRAQIFDQWGKKNGTEFVVNQQTTDDQKKPAVAALDNGGFAVVWEDKGTGKTHAREFDADGVAAGAEYTLHATSAGDHDKADVINLGNDKLLYLAKGSDSDGEILYAIRDVDAGTTGTTHSLTPEAGGDMGEARAAVLHNGHFVIAYHAKDSGGGWKVQFQRVNDNGSTIGQPKDAAVNNAIETKNADVIALDGGGFAVVWQQYGGNEDIMMRLFNQGGNGISGDILVNQSSADKQKDPRIAALEEGRFVVTWTDEGMHAGDTDEHAVRGQVFNSDGTLYGDEFLINSLTTGKQEQPEIEALADGGFVVSWTDESGHYDNVGKAVRHKIFNEDGSVRRSDQHEAISVEGAGQQVDPTILGLADGSIFSVWTSERAGNGTNDLAQAQFDALGTRTSDDAADEYFVPQTVNFEDASLEQFATGEIIAAWRDFTADNQGGIRYGIMDQHGDVDTYLLNTTTAGIQFDAELTALSNNSVAASWTSLHNDNGDIMGSIIDLNSGNRPAEFQINQNTIGTQDDAHLAALDGGGFVAVWTSEDSPGDLAASQGISARIFDDTGAAQGNEITLNTNVSGIQHEADVVGTEDGGFFAVWTNMVAQDGDRSGIIGRFFDDQGAGQSTELVINTTVAEMQRDASAARLEDGDIVVTWTDYSQAGSGTSAIRGQIIDGETGGKIGLEFVLEDDAVNFYGSDVTALADGGFAVAFEADGPLYGDMDAAGVRMQVFNADGTARQEVSEGPTIYRAALSQEVVAGDTVSTATGDFTINGDFSGDVDLGAHPGTSTQSETTDLGTLLNEPSGTGDGYSSSNTPENDHSGDASGLA